MGYMRHHAIVVTGPDYDDAIGRAHRLAVELFDPLTSGLVSSRINGYHSFFIAPDGSKEGWRESNRADVLRDQFKEWLRGAVYDDGSSRLDWVEVQYGDGDRETRVCADSDSERRLPLNHPRG